jgi:hypothetical protein
MPAMPNNDDARSYDPSLGKNALAALRETLDALPEDDVVAPNSDSETGALAGLVLVDVARRPEVAKRFALLPAAVFDPETVERLAKAAWALWYTQVESRTASATQTAVRVDPAVVAESVELKGRLQKLLEYHLGDQPELALELADIRLGTGYSDLASDLQRYARLSDDHPEEVTGDRKLFRKGDARRARELAGLIIADLKGSMSDRASVTNLRNRAWTLLSRDYGEVVATGAFLFRHEPALARLFVPLRAAVAPHRSRRPAEDTTDGTTPPDPTK